MNLHVVEKLGHGHTASTRHQRRVLVTPVVGLVVFASVFTFGVIFSRVFVPLQMHDDYEYTYPAFSLVRAGNLGSPLRGTGLNIEHRTYNLVVYYYAAVHSVLIRIFGDRPESIPLANLFHFAVIVAILAVYALIRPIRTAILITILCFCVDTIVLLAALAGRSEMTVAFGYFLATLMLYERCIWKNDSKWILLLASCGAVAAGLSHTGAGVILLAPIFVLFVLVDARRLLESKNFLAFTLPFCVPVLLYAYFLLTDDWRNLYLQIRSEFGELTFAKHWNLLLHAAIDEMVRSAQRLRNFYIVGFLWLLPGVLIGAASWLARKRRHQTWIKLQKQVETMLFFGLCFVSSSAMNWFFLKDFVGGYTVIYRTSYYLTLAASCAVVVTWAEELLPALLPRQIGRLPWRSIPAIAVLLAVVVAAGYHVFAVAKRAQYHAFGTASYRTFREELSGRLSAVGAKPGDKVYCPSPFGTHLTPQFAVVTFGGDRYFSNLWSVSFDKAVERTSAFRPDEPSLHFEKLVVFVNPKWIVVWDEDYSYLQGFAAFVESFPNWRREVRIARAGEFRSPSTYKGTIRIYRVDLDPGFSAALDRNVYPERSFGTQ